MNQFLDAVVRVWTGMPLILTTFITLIAGWLAAVLSRFLVTKTLKILRADKLSERLGVDEFLRKGGVQYSVIQLIGVLTFWIFIGATLIIISTMLDITVVTALWNRVLSTLPGVFAGLLITALGIILVTFFANFTLTIARNAGWPQADLWGKAIKYSGIFVVALIALEQIGFRGNVLSYLLLIAFAALALGLALAFGLGCKDLARGWMERVIRNLRERGRSAHPTDLEG
ncbi:MAG: hypothetical protein JW923_12275 [Spirochaetales bacterium]|nr:hypothetical protein [Spirochaetales bacterium]